VIFHHLARGGELSVTGCGHRPTEAQTLRLGNHHLRPPALSCIRIGRR
jgi:hypothetical protein